LKSQDELGHGDKSLKSFINDEQLFGSLKDEFIEIESNYISKLEEIKNTSENRRIILHKIEAAQQETEFKLKHLFDKIRMRVNKYI
jgi:hypothetical protein